jgi:hypothetical protein
MSALRNQHQPRSALTAVVTLTSALILLTITLTPAAASRAATSPTSSKCRIVIRGAHWSIREPRGRISGNKYTLTARDVSCSSMRGWVVKLTHVKIKGSGQQGLGQTLKGPAGYKYRSISEAASGDQFVYTGVCLHPPHNDPSFGWAPKP